MAISSPLHLPAKRYPFLTARPIISSLYWFYIKLHKFSGECTPAPVRMVILSSGFTNRISREIFGQREILLQVPVDASIHAKQTHTLRSLRQKPSPKKTTPGFNRNRAFGKILIVKMWLVSRGKICIGNLQFLQRLSEHHTMPEIPATAFAAATADAGLPAAWRILLH